MLTIEFAPGRFRNRAIELYPFKLTGPARINLAEIKAVRLDGKPDEPGWITVPERPLLGGSAVGSTAGPGTVRLATSGDWLYVMARLADPVRQVQISSSGAGKSASKLVLSGEHVRVELTDGSESAVWAISPEQIPYHSVDGKDAVTTAQAMAAPGQGYWTAEFAIPLQRFADRSKLRINVAHRSKEASKGITLRSTYREYELRPSFGLGTNPDLIPDWKPTTSPDRFAEMLWPMGAESR